MTDVVLAPVRSGYNLSKINSNFTKIEDSINDEIFHRIGGNNIMQQNVDMNNNDIINTNSIYATEGVFSTRILLGGTDYEIVLQNIADAAQVSADASAVSAAESEVSAIASEASSASSAASLDEFQDIYWGAYASEPTLSPVGNPATDGDLYFNTSDTVMKVYTGVSPGWVNAASAVNGIRNEEIYTNVAGQTVFPLTYDLGFVDAYVNGVKLIQGSDFTALDGMNVTLLSPIVSADDTVQLIAYTSIEFGDFGDFGPALNGKVDKDGAKVLTTNDLTDTLKTKLDGIASGAQVNEVTTTQLNAKEDGLGNPVSNGQVLTSQTDGTRSWATPTSGGINVKADWNEADNTSDAFIENKPTIPAPVDISGKEDSLNNPTTDGYILASQTDGTRSWVSPTSGGTNVKADWNEADNTSDAFIANKPTIPVAGEVNVQSDWSEADDTSDSFIANKPTITDYSGKEDGLGNPASNGQVLTSQTDGTRSWATPASSGGENIQSDWNESDNTSDAFIENKPTITDYSGKENGLGTPTTDGQILSSTVAGSRSWIDAPSGGGSSVNSSFRLFEDALAHAIAVQRRAAPTMKLTSRGEVERTSADAAQVWIKPKWMLPVNTYFEFGATVEANDILSERSVRLSPITRLGINYRKGFKVMFLRQKNLTRINLVTSNSPSTPRGRVFSSVDTSSVPAPNLGTMNRVGMSYDESTGVSTVVISTDGITEESLVVDTTEDLLGWDMELGDNRPVNAVGNTTLFNFGTEPFQGGVPEGAVTLAQFPRINNWPVKLWGGGVTGTVANDLLDYPLGGADSKLTTFDNQGKFSLGTTVYTGHSFTEITPLSNNASQAAVSRVTGVGDTHQQDITQGFTGYAFNMYAMYTGADTFRKNNIIITEIYYKP